MSEKNELNMENNNTGVPAAQPRIPIRTWVLWVFIGIVVVLIYSKLYPGFTVCLRRSGHCPSIDVVMNVMVFWILVFVWPITAVLSIVPIITFWLVSIV
jgi:hypothetical protein